MQLHLLVALLVLGAVGVMVDTSVKLYKLRRAEGPALPFNYIRDARVLVRSGEYPVREVRWVVLHWAGWGAFWLFCALFVIVAPERA